MSSSQDDARARLLAGAVAGELTAREKEELERLRASEPWIDDEIAGLRAAGAALAKDARENGPWIEVPPTDDLRERIAGIGTTPAKSEGDAHLVPRSGRSRRSRGRRRTWAFAITAAGCLGVGLALGAAVPAVLSAPPSGPPGTLGALENVQMTEEPAGAEIEADLVPHTWGTEAMLDARGLEVGAVYSIVLISADGQEHSAGAMIGSEVPIHCRVNAAVLRADVTGLEIRDETDTVVASATVPPV